MTSKSSLKPLPLHKSYKAAITAVILALSINVADFYLEYQNCFAATIKVSVPKSLGTPKRRILAGHR
jgi:hypothetical protein